VNYSNNPSNAQEAVAALEKSGGQASAVQADGSRTDDVARLFQQTLRLRLNAPNHEDHTS
jgi:3-oxoacyl-[acyl-carrier protein] reductase